MTTYEEFEAAVEAAKQAFPAWRNTPVTVRQRIMFKFQELIRRDIVRAMRYSLLTIFLVVHALPRNIVIS